MARPGRRSVKAISRKMNWSMSGKIPIPRPTHPKILLHTALTHPVVRGSFLRTKTVLGPI